eukprot:m.129171 g.129171  ORF g.129171 m.129171 type:complete len:369 (-) comp13659_c0_seq1:122-1228(-)
MTSSRRSWSSVESRDGTRRSPTTATSTRGRSSPHCSARTAAILAPATSAGNRAKGRTSAGSRSECTDRSSDSAEFRPLHCPALSSLSGLSNPNPSPPVSCTMHWRCGLIVPSRLTSTLANSDDVMYSRCWIRRCTACCPCLDGVHPTGSSSSSSEWSSSSGSGLAADVERSSACRAIAAWTSSAPSAYRFPSTKYRTAEAVESPSCFTNSEVKTKSGPIGRPLADASSRLRHSSAIELARWSSRCGICSEPGLKEPAADTTFWVNRCHPERVCASVLLAPALPPPFVPLPTPIGTDAGRGERSGRADSSVQATSHDASWVSERECWPSSCSAPSESGIISPGGLSSPKVLFPNRSDRCLPESLSLPLL